MTKKEIIIKHWIDLGIETPFGVCDKTGYYHGYFCNGVDDILDQFGLKTEQIDYDLDPDGVGKFRPKSLQGIEDNNGWNIGFPEKDGGNYWVYIESLEGAVFVNSVSNYDEFYGDVNGDTICFKQHQITHFQEVKKPKPPIYYTI